MLWSYQDARGVPQYGHVEKTSDHGGTDVTYFLRRLTGELDVLSGSRLKDAQTMPESLPCAKP